MQALMAFITGYSGGLSIQCRILRLGNLNENLFSCDYSFSGSPTGDVAHPLGDMSLVNTMSHLSYSSHCFSFFISLVVEEIC